MSHVQFTKLYRPKTFDDVISQKETVQVLRNSIINNNILNLILLHGQRGSGKTTSARIYAAAVNCDHPVNGSPCGCCPSCKEVFSGTSSDIIEVDAASNRGIQEMKDLIKQLDYATFSLKYRVVILDEVHALTPESWQSLLKTLEEPRPNTVFILCTTELDKVPDTILSRAVSLNVGKIKTQELVQHLESICEKENVQYDRVAINVIAKRARGICRDAVKDLDTVVSVFGRANGHEVQQIFSVVETRVMLDFVSTCFHEEVQVILNETKSLANLFPNEEKFLQGLYTVVLDCLKLKLGVNLSEDYSQEDISEMQGIIKRIPSKFLYAFLNKIKKQLETLDPNLPVLDYLAISVKQEEVEKAVGAVEEKPQEKPQFDLGQSLDDI